MLRQLEIMISLRGKKLLVLLVVRGQATDNARLS